MRSFFFFLFFASFHPRFSSSSFSSSLSFFPFSRSISLSLASERKGDRVRKSVSSSGTAIWKTRSGRPWRWQSVLHAREGRSPVFFLYSIGLALLFSLSLSFAPLISLPSSSYYTTSSLIRSFFLTQSSVSFCAYYCAQCVDSSSLSLFLRVMVPFFF